MNMDNFDEDEKMDSYDEKNVASCICHSCGQNVMIPEPEKGDKIFCPYCKCIIRGKVLGEGLDENKESEEEKDSDDENEDEF